MEAHKLILSPIWRSPKATHYTAVLVGKNTETIIPIIPLDNKEARRMGMKKASPGLGLPPRFKIHHNQNYKISKKLSKALGVMRVSGMVEIFINDGENEEIMEFFME